MPLLVRYTLPQHPTILIPSIHVLPRNTRPLHLMDSNLRAPMAIIRRLSVAPRPIPMMGVGWIFFHMPVREEGNDDGDDARYSSGDGGDFVG